MKRISLIAFAILFLAGCAKEYDDTAIKDRLDVLEEQIKDNTNALKKLSKKLDEAAEQGLTVSVAQTAEGKTLTFSDGTVLTVKDGAKGDQGPQGQPGDDGADSVVTITDSADGSSYVINVAGNEYVVRKTQTFSLTLAATELSMAPGSSKEIAYTLTGADAATTVFVQACSGYTAVVDMEASTVTVTAPAELPEDAYVIITARKNSTGEESSQYLGKSSQSVMTAANCFIISKAGTYYFYTVKGNSYESVGNVASCELLWETYNTAEYPEKNTLIKSVSYADGVIAFQTVDTFKEGNAGIAAKDAEGNILWSWHIWLTDQPAEQVYYNNAGTFLDRNLGALSATPGEVEALGLMYQWGRKDPFLGSASVSERKQTGSTLKVEHANSEVSDWPTIATNAERGTIAWAIANPTTFIGFTYDLAAASNTYDWIYTEDLTSDKTRWNPDTKTIYDPCPAGWRVPHKNFTCDAVDAVSLGYYDSAAALDETNHGLNWGGIFGSDENIWYPFSGDRGQDNGNLSQVATEGCYWTASFHDTKPQAYAIQNYKYYSDGSFSRTRKDCSKAYAVRCMKEQ